MFVNIYMNVDIFTLQKIVKYCVCIFMSPYSPIK